MAQSATEKLDTFPKLLRRNAAVRGSNTAFRHKDLGIWQSWTWAEVYEIVRAYAVGMKALGLVRGDKVAIVGANRPKLYWSMMAAQVLGAVPVRDARGFSSKHRTLPLQERAMRDGSEERPAASTENVE